MSAEKMTPVDLGVDDQALFDATETDDAPETPVAESAEAEQPEQTRDEAGRFAAKAADEPVQDATQTDQSAKPPVDDNAAAVPSWRVREINEEKRAYLAELETLRAERAQWQQRQQQQPEAKPAEKAAKPDPLLDPEGYAAAVRDEIRQEIISERREESLQRAREANPKEFDEAYAAATKVIDPALKARMQSARDPGKTLLEWHRENRTRQEIGGDLNAYKQRLREEALKDPEFRKQAIAAWQSEAQPQVNGRPRVELPPSLNGASRSAAGASLDNDMSDEGLWQHANA